jgi:phosphopantothenoylcysteine decarboxylase/phosphopantothenate--cysteine ligase
VLSGKRILLIVAGGIAAYKSLELIRRLKERGVAVRCILTEAAKEFVTPLSVAALSGDKVYGELFSLTDEAEMGHIQLSRDADLLIVAPATADLLARMASGLASDLATTALLATDKPVLIAPAMNVRMWNHPATRRNLATLHADGVLRVGPNDGDMACGEFGPGRMAEPHEILAAVERYFAGSGNNDRPLHGRRALVTSGPTHEPIDPVRYIANRSSGKQGHAIAAALAEFGAETVLISGPSHEPIPSGVNLVQVESARDMLAACEAALPADIAVCAAAVADWRVDQTAAQKIKKKAGSLPTLALIENPDILATLSGRKRNRPELVVGFAAETENLIANARAKLKKKHCDWILANDVSPATGTFGGERNTVHLVTADQVEDWPSASKKEVAARLVQCIVRRFNGER